MKILLIFLDMCSFQNIEYHFGLAYISSYLKKEGHSVRYVYLSSLEQTNNLCSQIKKFSPDIVGFTAVESQYAYVNKLSKLVKENHPCFVICGGVYVTLFPEAVSEAPYLDGIIIGEGEEAFLQLIKNMQQGKDYRRTPNFCYLDKARGEVVKNVLLPLIKNLDTLPFPDRNILDYKSYIYHHGLIEFIFNRGCPYNCTYCSNHALAAVYGLPKNYIRFRSVDNCLSEIEEVLSKYGSNNPLYFGDDIFTLNLPWLYEFLDKYKKNFNKRSFVCHTRSNLASKEMFRRLRDAGCYRVVMSVESGNEFIRNKVMKRNISKEQIYNSFRWANELRLETIGVSIIGVPYETKETILETIKTIAEIDTTSIHTHIFCPYKGTELYEVCKKKGFLKEENLPEGLKERRQVVCELPNITKEEIQYFKDNFEELVLKHKPIIYRIKNRLRKIFSNYFRENAIWKAIKNALIVRFLRKAVRI